MKALVTGVLQATVEELNQLEDMGLEITFQQNERDEVKNPEQFEAVICNGLFLYNDIEKFTNLKYIQLTSAGTDRVPADYIQSHGMELHNAAGVYSGPMAEWTIMRLLELYKNADKLFANNSWNKDRTWRELGGKTACVIGFGSNGKAIAKRLKAFDVDVCIVNRTKKESQFVDEFYPIDMLDEALRRADIVILAIALTEETRQLMNAKRFSEMKDGAVFINAARGALVDEAALVDALNNNLAGAALDVFEVEPLSDDSPLWQVDNLLISPHNSFVGENNHKRLMNVVFNNLTINKVKKILLNDQRETVSAGRA